MVCLILHLEEERMFVGKIFVEGNNKRESRESSKVGFNKSQHQHIFTRKEEEEEKNLLMFVVMFIKLLIDTKPNLSKKTKYVVEK